ncbi:MAG: hypothetical protein GXP15_11535 [Gammaproteobacteria bacterium]|nr:hypothetical protein [Gammaproteobacteria bacterium]
MKSKGILVLIAVALVAACGGGGTQVAGIDGGGAPAPVAVAVAKGTITGFGSIIVNDVRYDISSATITVEGSPANETDLAVGQVVVVKGSLGSDGTTGIADSVDFDDILEGPISAIDTLAGTLTVLGQLVRVDADTSFDTAIIPASLGGLVISDIVEISGFFLADGSIGATRVERKLAGSAFEVQGTVSNVNATTLQISNLVVDYSAATIDNFPGGMPEDGQQVEAQGTMFGASGELLATRIEFKGGALAEDGDHVEIEGFITRFGSATDFDVEGITVATDGNTQFENGASMDLALNRKVEVEGEIDTAGVLVASKVELKLSGFVRIESLVEDVQANQITLLGIAVNVDASTRIEDKSDADLRPFSLADIVVGDFVVLRGVENANGVTATRLEREDFDDEVALRGFVDSVNDPDFTILGVTVQTAGGTTFQDENDNSITPAAFFGQAQGSLVEAVGVLSSGTIIATEVDIEN